jgi:hypothetical protein
MPSNTEIYINELTKLIEFDVLNLDSVVKNTIDPEFSLTDFILGQSESSYEKDGLEMQSMYQEIKFFLLIAIMVVVFCLVLLIASFFKIFKTKVSE